MTPRQQYDAAIAQLREDPNSLVHQHQAVLALARAGSLTFALQEYERYGLGQIKAHPDPQLLEDVISLQGRLYKDLYVTTSGPAAQEHALNAAQCYEAAFKATSGFYSAINSATMSWLGGVPSTIVTARARRVLELVDKSVQNGTENQTAVSDQYFAEATKAEALSLLGDDQAARQSLRRAWDCDPLGYMAQASTLKQFRMMSEKREKPIAWLDEFTPPKAMHFAGPIFQHDLSAPKVDDLTRRLTDCVQKNDIGFGFGALAAGSDILIAEALLNEGGQLHVVLPTNKANFVDQSVRPFGDPWVDRFEACWQAATSHFAFNPVETATFEDAIRFSSALAMGRALRHAENLSVTACQMIVAPSGEGVSITDRDAALWRQTGAPQFSLAFHKEAAPSSSPSPADLLKNVVCVSQGDGAADIDPISTLQSKLTTLWETLKTSGGRFGLHAALGEESLNIDIVQSLRESAFSDGIYVSEAAANLIALLAGDQYASGYIGETESGVPSFVLRTKGAA